MGAHFAGALELVGRHETIDLLERDGPERLGFGLAGFSDSQHKIII